MKEIEEMKVENIVDTKHEILFLLKQRYSPRVFKNKQIDNKHINQLFEAVRWSASSSNLQPWRFIYAKKGTQAYQTIYDCLSDFNKKWTENAPLLMLTAYKEKDDEGKENFHALHDLGLCLGSMTVQAEFLNIGVHHMAGVDWKKAQQVFNVPDGFHITTAIALGYYGGSLDDLPKDLREQEIADRTRIEQEKFAFKEAWNNN
ncbi:MAG: nitroreductase family protein [Flavobacteriales bacterium]